MFSKNEPVLKILLDCGKVKFELKNSDGHTPLWLALQQVCRSQAFYVIFIVKQKFACEFTRNKMKDLPLITKVNFCRGRSWVVQEKRCMALPVLQLS